MTLMINLLASLIQKSTEMFVPLCYTKKKGEHLKDACVIQKLY